jgi:GNAT superfamily N-acetyltransferase
MLNKLTLPVDIQTRSGTFALRRARAADLDAVLVLLWDDAFSVSGDEVPIGRDRILYLDALERIIASNDNDLVIVVDEQDLPVSMLQLTCIPGLGRRGANRLLIEAVRVRNELRSAGVGTALIKWVVDDAATTLDADLVQLTSLAGRSDAHRFYERIGFVGSHVGFRLSVPRDVVS